MQISSSFYGQEYFKLASMSQPASLQKVGGNRVRMSQGRSMSRGSGLKLKKSLRGLHCKKIFPKQLSKDKRTNFIGKLLPEKYIGLERVNVFSPPSVKWPSNKRTFNCIYCNCIVTSRVVQITVVVGSLRGPSSSMQTSKPRMHE